MQRLQRCREHGCRCSCRTSQLGYRFERLRLRVGVRPPFPPPCAHCSCHSPRCPPLPTCHAWCTYPRHHQHVSLARAHLAPYIHHSGGLVFLTYHASNPCSTCHVVPLRGCIWVLPSCTTCGSLPHPFSS